MRGIETGITALLPMKLHSERVPGKNFRQIGGKPLFMWILGTLLSLEEISRVVINTDARQKLGESGLQESERVMIRDRRSELCGDFTDMNLVLADDISNVVSGIYLMTHTTNPLLTAATIRNAVRAFTGGLADGNCDSLFSVTRYQSRFYRPDGSAVNHDPGVLIRTQDLEPLYEENSCLYLFTGESFGRQGRRIGQKPLMYEVPRLEAVDIDNQDDFNLAETLLLQQC